MFYLPTQSTHFNYSYMASHRTNQESKRGNPLPPHGLFFYMHHPSDRIAHTKAFVTSVVEHWLEQEIAQWVDQTTHHTVSKFSYHRATFCSHMVKDNSDSKRGNLLSPLHGLLFLISSKECFICNTLCCTSCGSLAGKEIAQSVHHEGSIRRPIAP